MSPGFHADFSTDKSLEKHRCYIPSLPHTCSGLVFWVGFGGPNTEPQQVFGCLGYICSVPWYSHMIFFLWQHHTIQIKINRAKRNKTHCSVLPSIEIQLMILILPWFCKPKAMIFHQKKKVGSLYLLSCTCLSNLFGPRIPSLLRQFHRMHISKCSNVKHHSWSTATCVSSRPAWPRRSWDVAASPWGGKNRACIGPWVKVKFEFPSLKTWRHYLPT